MSESLTSYHLTSSQLRRIRAKATKQRMYSAADREHHLCCIQSQLAMLTTTIDTFTNLVLKLIGSDHEFKDGSKSGPLNPQARAFVPACSRTENWEQQPSSEPVESRQLAAVGACSGDCRDSRPFGSQTCVTCSELADNCFCSAVPTCRQCWESKMVSSRSQEAQRGSEQESIPQQPQDEATSKLIDKCIDDFIEEQFKHLRAALHKPLRDMAAQAFSKGFSSEVIEDNFVEICAGKLQEGIANMRSQVMQRWPQWVEADSIETKMYAKFRECVRFWMSDLSRSCDNPGGSDRTGRLQPLTRRGMSQPKSKESRRRKQ